MTTKLNPIGIIHTPYKKMEKRLTTRTNRWTSVKSKSFTHFIILYEFHKSVKRSVKNDHYLESQRLLVKPYLDDIPHGLFATRSPNRPNPIGLTIVELLERRGNILKVRGIDMLDGTPLLDIKPYVPKFDRRNKVKIGWREGKV